MLFSDIRMLEDGAFSFYYKSLGSDPHFVGHIIRAVL